ncbi:MAG: V-type ATPase 116kDa subunit family protein [Treponema sp.]|nr:V-type ATPase 116kDa subunit family protein [Treponema sp.]
MARTTTMRLLELMVLREDIHPVLMYLGKFGDFQFQQNFEEAGESDYENNNPAKEMFNELQNVRAALDLEDLTSYKGSIQLPTDEDKLESRKIIDRVEELHQKELLAAEEFKNVTSAYNEAVAFSNLKMSYSQLESLSFLTLRIGKIDGDKFESLKEKTGGRAIIVSLGEDKSRILAAASKKARFLLDSQLREAGFVEIQVPEDFKGIPDDMIESLLQKKLECSAALEEIKVERKNFALTHKDEIYRLLQEFSVESQVYAVENKLQSTEFVYRITGWIPAYESHEFMKAVDELTKGRTSIREYLPGEVPSVINGEEKVPVQLKHGKLISNFERLIFSYGSPLYGTVDPTPLVAVFFTILFGIMFGDAGQGLVFLIAGILMSLKKMKLAGWEKFGPIFICIGISSTIMGILTGEFFAKEIMPLEKFSYWVTGLFGEPRSQILPMMPTGSGESIKRMFMFFGFTIAVGFIINTSGIIINIINNFALGRKGKAVFGKNGLSGAIFFWYIVWMCIRIALLKIGPAFYDWIIIGTALVLTAFCEPLERLIDGERPVLENGILSAFIGALVEIIEVLSGYISNTVSFLRVGAFALSHAVLSYIISMMMSIAPFAGAVVIGIVGNAVIIVLEGMIVAIQVVRLQYYEFFSKFFNETGREFKPFAFVYKS